MPAKRTSKGRNIPALIAQVGREQGLSPAQIRAMIATSKVESNWDPNAIGDGGTSFGLFQHHIGGAGGSASTAPTYKDPIKSISERAKWFKQNNITNGQGAAALQRPADPSGYAVKVNNALKGIGGSVLNAPISSAGPVSPSAGLGEPAPSAPSRHIGAWGQSFLADYLYGDDPVMRSVIASTFEEDPVAAVEPAGEIVSPTPSAPKATGQSVAYRGKLKTYKDILALGRQFGLKNDPGNSQTTGGKHTAGSLHYSGKAVDFGDAKNSPDKLRAFNAYVARHAGELGIKQTFYNPSGYGIINGKKIVGHNEPGHGDHLHVGIY